MSILFKKQCLPMALACLLPMALHAQQARKLPLEEALSLAKQHSHQLKADSIQHAIADTRLSQSKSGILPQLNLSANYMRLSDNITAYSISLPNGSFTINPQILNQSYNSIQLSQPLYSGSKTTNAIKASRKELAASKADYEKSRLDIDNLVTILWFNLYNANASQKTVLANIETLRQRRADQQAFLQQGLVLDNDVLKIDLSITNLQSSLADINSMLATLNYNLCVATGIDPATTIDIPEEYVHPVSELAPLAQYMNAALEQRAELKGFKLREEAASYRLKAAKGNYFPSLNLIGSYSYDQPNQRVIPNVAQFNYSAYVGLGLTWRISSLYTNHAVVSESKLSRYQLQSNYQQSIENIQKEVNSNYQEYKKYLDKVTLVKTELEQANENYRVEQNKLNAQTTTLTDFLIANTNLLQAQLDMATAKANAELSYKKLIQSTGTTN